jgi:hypothetical protein
MLVAQGSDVALLQANEQKCSARMMKITAPLPFVFLLVTMEMQDEHPAVFDDVSTLSIGSVLANIIECPRETIRFLHKR